MAPIQRNTADTEISDTVLRLLVCRFLWWCVFLMRASAKGNYMMAVLLRQNCESLRSLCDYQDDFTTSGLTASLDILPLEILEVVMLNIPLNQFNCFPQLCLLERVSKSFKKAAAAIWRKKFSHLQIRIKYDGSACLINSNNYPVSMLGKVVNEVTKRMGTFVSLDIYAGCSVDSEIPRQQITADLSDIIRSRRRLFQLVTLKLTLTDGIQFSWFLSAMLSLELEKLTIVEIDTRNTMISESMLIPFLHACISTNLRDMSLTMHKRNKVIVVVEGLAELLKRIDWSLANVFLSGGELARNVHSGVDILHLFRTHFLTFFESAKQYGRTITIDRLHGGLNRDEFTFLKSGIRAVCEDNGIDVQFRPDYPSCARHLQMPWVKITKNGDYVQINDV